MILPAASAMGVATSGGAFSVCTVIWLFSAFTSTGVYLPAATIPQNAGWLLANELPVCRKPFSFVEEKRTIFGNFRENWITAVFLGIEDAGVFDMHDGIAAAE